MTLMDVNGMVAQSSVRTTLVRVRVRSDDLHTQGTGTLSSLRAPSLGVNPQHPHTPADLDDLLLLPSPSCWQTRPEVSRRAY